MGRAYHERCRTAGEYRLYTGFDHVEDDVDDVLLHSVKGTEVAEECQKRGTTCTRSTIQLSVHHVGQMERAYHERCPTAEE